MIDRSRVDASDCWRWSSYNRKGYNRSLSNVRSRIPLPLLILTLHPTDRKKHATGPKVDVREAVDFFGRIIAIKPLTAEEAGSFSPSMPQMYADDPSS